MFWKVYHLFEVMRNAARSPRSVPSSVLPPKIYITSLTNAAEWPSRGAGMYPIQSCWVQELVAGLYVHTSLNHWVPLVPPKLQKRVSGQSKHVWLHLQKQLVIVADNSVVRSSSRYFASQTNIVNRILYQKFPLICGIL